MQTIRGELVNLKMEKLMATFGVIVRYGLAYTPWLNGIDERNHASCDITIKKLMKEKKTQLNNSLVKAAS